MARFGIAACILAAGVVTSAQQEPPVFRGAGDTVPVFATVTDRSDRFVTSLTREQFTIRDNGKPQPLALFDNTPQPIRLIVLIDLSGSMYGNLPLVREAGAELFKRLRPDDLAAVGTFGRQISIGAFTRDAQALTAALPQSIEEDAPTPLWRALTQAIDTFGDTPGRRVVLVISDGKDTPAGAFGQKYVGSFEVLDRAHSENVMVYAVAMQSRMRRGGMGGGSGDLMGRLTSSFPSPEFGKTAVETGGGYVELRPRDDLGASFARIADELHSQYLLGFAPPAADGKRHEIEVRLAESGLKVRARKYYMAPRAAR